MGPLKVTLSNPSAQAGPATARGSGLCPDTFWRFPSMEILQPPWTTCASAPSLSQCRNVSWCSERTSCVSGCAHCVWFCHWAPLKKTWLCPLCTFPHLYFFPCLSFTCHHEITLRFQSICSTFTFVHWCWWALVHCRNDKLWWATALQRTQKQLKCQILKQNRRLSFSFGITVPVIWRKKKKRQASKQKTHQHTFI